MVALKPSFISDDLLLINDYIQTIKNFLGALR